MARRYETLVGRPHDRSDDLYADALVYGPIPVSDALQLIDEVGSMRLDDWASALLLAMSGRFDEARVRAQGVEQHARELGRTASVISGEIEALSGNHKAAADQIGAWCVYLEKRGQTAGVAGYTAQHARALCLSRLYEEADQRAAEVRELMQRLYQPDPLTQSLWRQASALVAAHRGEHSEAEGLAREVQGDAYVDLAEVLEAAGRREEAAAAWHEALDRYERKGVIPLARRVRERLSAMAGDAVP
jgi:hypothetical protein